MGSSQSMPEFVTVLANKQVKIGDVITLECEANTEDVTATWEKNGQKLECVNGKHSIKQYGKSFALEIKNAEEQDEGNYTIHLKRKSDCSSCSSIVNVALHEWRTVQWTQDEMMNSLKAFHIGNEAVHQLQFLLCGPIGGGKSSVINTIKTIFEGRLFVNCLAAPQMTAVSTSHTLRYEKYPFGNAQDGLHSFVINDVMGIEHGKSEGVCSEDIISALKGHMKEGYTFNSKTPLTEQDLYYHKHPSLNDRMHCLVIAVPADTFSMVKDFVVQKMKNVRDKAVKLGLPQVVLMTRVDRACPLTKNNLRNVYKSKKIKDKMNECSLALGVPVNCIFPVGNYHEETDIKQDINCLMLYALTRIVHWANDYVVKNSNS